MVSPNNHVMPTKRSIFKDLYEKRKSLAVRIGLIGVILLLLSLLAKEMIPLEQNTGIWHISNVIIELFGKIGEAFILSGFVVFVLEEHPLAMMVKDVSKSIIDEIIDKHFQRNELLGFILRGIKNLNKYENIDEEIYNLYEKHGLLELTDEPRRSNVSIIFKKEGEVEGERDKILLNRIYDFRATNEAREGGSFKRINGDGLVAFFDSPVPTVADEDENEILNDIRKYLDVKFEFSTSFEVRGSTCNKERMCLNPVFLPGKDFDIENCRPKKNGRESEKTELYGVYEIVRQSDDNSLLKLNFYLNVKIPPKEFIDLCFEVKGIVSDYDLWTYEFISYSKGVTFDLNFGDDFETKIEEVLIGVQNTPVKSNTKLKYNGWIMPHSSISGTWRRKAGNN
ncbi:Uncharacterised protein [uncultured archaeon]|nr:Uncharacterised protein [uncultured archaeon]